MLILILVWEIRDEVSIGVRISQKVSDFLQETPHVDKFIQFGNPDDVPGFCRDGNNPQNSPEEVGG